MRLKCKKLLRAARIHSCTVVWEHLLRRLLTLREEVHVTPYNKLFYSLSHFLVALCLHAWTHVQGLDVAIENQALHLGVLCSMAITVALVFFEVKKN